MEGQERYLSDFLLESGLVSHSQLTSAQRQKGKSLSHALIEGGILSEEEVRRAAAHALGIPYVVLERGSIDPEALSLIPEPLCREHGVIAYRVGERGIEVALLDMAALDALSFLSETRRVLPRLTSQDSLRKALLMYQKILKERFGSNLESARTGKEALEALLLHALNQHAQDIYIEPGEGAIVRYRAEGAVRPAMQLSKKVAEKIIAHLTNERKIDTRFKISLHGSVASVRTSLLKTAAGERLSLHLSPPGCRGFTLEQLGLWGEALEAVHHSLFTQRGLIVVAGPHRSGTTTTLYTLLDMLSRPSRSVMSIEQEIEFHVPQVAQTQLQSELGLSALAALRGALRQNPDVLMLHDIEDEAALSLAQEASKRCLVLVGLRDASLAAPQALIIKQRLVRTLCPHYREVHLLSRAEAGAFEGTADFGAVLAALKDANFVSKTIAWKDVPFYRAEPCSECEGGYRGAIGLFEVQTAQQKQGLTLAEDGLCKAARGETSIAEVVQALRE